MDNRSGSLASTCRLERGIYVFRYVEAGSDPCPRAQIEVRRGDISLVHAPGRGGSALDAPGQALVMVAEGPGECEITVSAVGFGGTDAKFNLDLIDPGEAATWRAAPAATPFDAGRRQSQQDRVSAPSRDGADLSVVAHVSRRGDVARRADEWVAGPDEVLPIEGLAIATGRPDLEIRVRVQSARGGPSWSPWSDAEGFAGSRQQADPLTGIGLALTGDAAAQFEIAADVMALGSPPATKTGRLVEFFGIDPIVGFRLRLNAVTGASAPPLARPASPLRVFRAKK